MLVAENKIKLSSSPPSHKRASSSSAERKSVKKFGGMLRIVAIKSAMLFTSALARIPRTARACNDADWPFALPFRPMRTSSLGPVSSDKW